MFINWAWSVVLHVSDRGAVDAFGLNLSAISWQVFTLYDYNHHTVRFVPPPRWTCMILTTAWYRHRCWPLDENAPFSLPAKLLLDWWNLFLLPSPIRTLSCSDNAEEFSPLCVFAVILQDILLCMLLMEPRLLLLKTKPDPFWLGKKTTARDLKRNGEAP